MNELKKLHIVFLDGHTLHATPQQIEELQSCGNLTIFDRTEESEVISRSKDADVLIVNKTPLQATTLKQLPKLRLVCVAGTGFDKVDAVAARQLGITVCNCANYSTRAVAQMALSLLLEAADHTGYYTQENLNGRWCRSKDFSYVSIPRVDLEGKKAAIIGFGHIGQTFADMLRPLGLQLYAVSSKSQDQLPTDVTKVDIDQAFAECDIVSLNCPLCEANRGFVNAALLQKAKPGLILINTARGALVNEQDVAEALTQHRLYAYCTDVLSQEPPLPDNPLLSAPNVFVTPHIGWMTSQTVERIINIICNNIQGFINGKPLNVVN